MRQYRPTIEQLKKRYSADMARRKRMEKIAASHPAGYKKIQIPDNSEPWLPHLPRSLAECMWISDQITQAEERLKNRLPVCDLVEATGMLNQFIDSEVLQYARTNPDIEVRELCLHYLFEFAAEGDPYSRDILAAWPTP